MRYENYQEKLEGTNMMKYRKSVERNFNEKHLIFLLPSVFLGVYLHIIIHYMSLEAKSQELKKLVSVYDTGWFLGNLSQLMTCIANNVANDQLGTLSSPLRQLYFLGGLFITTDPIEDCELQYSPEQWNRIVELLNEIEQEYYKLFFPDEDEVVDGNWKKVREVAMPSFLSYFNQGPLNYEEQTINWVEDLYTQLNDIIELETGIKTEHFVEFYNNLDKLVQANFQTHSTEGKPLRKDWDKYARLQVGTVEDAPDFIKEIGEKRRPLHTFVVDYGIINRFYAKELVSDTLTLDQVRIIVNLLSCSRGNSDFLYYTSTKPGNPLYEKPIISLEEDMYQVFEVKQVIHAIERLLESLCTKTKENTTKYVSKKGKLLEQKIIDLFARLLKKDYEIFQSYYVDGCEQDILILWKEYAFIIEAKGYKLREPLRDPNRAFVRIKDDFKDSIGYAYEQTNRVEKKFVEQIPLKIEDENGNLIKEIDTRRYENGDFSIIVNLKSFGQIQIDLSTLLELKENSAYPWVVRFDDLETFLLTLIAKRRDPVDFVNFLIIREELHGKLFCSDELEICGGYITGAINEDIICKCDKIATCPDLANIFDEQYRKGMGFKNEKLLKEKRSGKTLFWG